MTDQGHIELRAALTADRLAREAGTTPEYIARLVEAIGAMSTDGSPPKTCLASG